MEENTNQIAPEGIQEKPKTNPYNQYNTDPRRALAWTYYTDPESETFSNGMQSALKAGYADTSATHITLSPWWIEKSRRFNLLRKAERNLDEFLEMPIKTIKTIGRDDDKEEIIVTDPALVRIKQDTTKFVAERLGKEHYSNRSELTGKDGGPVMPPLNEGQRSKLDALLGAEEDDSDS